MSIVTRLNTIFRTAILAVAVLLVAAPAALGAAPTLRDHVTDQTGVLGSNSASVEQAISSLSSTANVDLWVLFVSTTNGTTASDYAVATFEANGLGGNDILLVVAVDDHRYGWDEIHATGLSTDQLNALCSQYLDPAFRQGDYAGGVVNFAGGLSDAVNGKTVSTPEPVATSGAGAGTTGGSSSGSNDVGTLLVFFGILGLVFVLVVVVAGLRAWRLSRLPAEERDRQTGDLARQANKLLVDTDDGITSARQELGFAQAEFTDADCAPFADAVTRADAELKAAFKLRQQLDDSTPEDPPTRSGMYNQIIAHCQTAGSIVAEQENRIQALRDLERTAPAVLGSLDDAIATLKTREQSVKGAVQTLSAYAPSAWASVKGNAEEADKRGAFAEAQVARGKAALAQNPPNKRDAASAARSAQEAVAAANQLLDMVEQLAKTLDDARGKLDGELNAAQADVVAAQAAANANPPNPALASQLAQAGALLQRAQAQAAAAQPDPIAALKAAQDAHALADTALNGVRQASEQRARAQTAYESTRQLAATGLAQASAYLAARTGVGTQARTRLAEAQRHLDQATALAGTDIAAATQEARTAGSMADDAYGLARSDVEGMPYVGGFGSGGGYGGGYGQAPVNSGGSNIGASILGGIVGGMLSGGGRRGGGFGGTPWGSSGGWSGGGHSSGFGGFGGGGGGHSGGGSFGGGGGGGGHSGGGGW
jgi:uncharacterized membrane protein YgcG